MDLSGNTVPFAAHSGEDCDLYAIHAAAEIADMTDATLFVASGLRAARGAPTIHRRLILTDLAQVLGCNPGELDFLFMEPTIAANDSDPVGMPDFRASLLAARH
ncbi:hypothetical protein ACFFUB_06360 [Algimonas porphyrae]|nr:hypothetical protein [Algimonas porphyrae]